MSNLNGKLAEMAVAVDIPSRMPILHPVTNVPMKLAGGPHTGMTAYIDLISIDSRKIRQFENSITNRRLIDQANRRNRNTPITAEQIEAEEYERLAEATVSWMLCGLDGAPIDIDCTPKNAAEVYESIGWLREQVQAWYRNLANFSKPPSKPLSPPPSQDSGSISPG